MADLRVQIYSWCALNLRHDSMTLAATAGKLAVNLDDKGLTNFTRADNGRSINIQGIFIA